MKISCDNDNNRPICVSTWMPNKPLTVPVAKLPAFDTSLVKDMKPPSILIAKPFTFDLKPANQPIVTKATISFDKSVPSFTNLLNMSAPSSKILLANMILKPK